MWNWADAVYYVFINILILILKQNKKQNRKKLAAGCSQLRWPEEFYCATSRQRLKAFTSAKSQQKLLISTQTTKRLIFLSSVSTWNNNNNITIVYPCMTSFRLMFTCLIWFDRSDKRESDHQLVAGSTRLGVRRCFPLQMFHEWHSSS